MRGVLLQAAMLGILINTNAGLRASEAPPGQSDQPATRFLAGPEPGTLRVSEIIGVPVIGMDHVRVGKIEDVLLDGSARVRTVVIGVGGFLGVGEKSVAVPFDQVSWNFSDVPLTGGSSSVTTPEEASAPERTAQLAPESMPGANTTRDVLGAVQNQHSGRVTDSTGSADATRPDGTPATTFAGSKPWHAEVRLTRAQLDAAPAFGTNGTSR
ncbi:PRC-barrel domain-containing protein [Methylobacterium gnaphalii]|uniref:Photosystem reaction center subunit H n=1 Tax=Methylobacterium gnaphalii TaxID=1010610 RepID=A0A512JQG0_9HYPH|nr:PRC-barrel domain-containing protein [Methylobacterium gnaphalii]GEP12194.1 photosystem reaction center subunit H [Methylobacterium gnaphalii]GJD67468.1 hypothetical protein MMMDOFMJ_0383 [Methylobacterium gnaphalii]GLS51316.1 photosystem reaction center subunit H [Methylobacterium gnaphalii]